MSKIPSLGIVIPVLNSEPALRRLLPTLMSDRLDLDVLVGDGGSEDDSVGAAARYQVRVTTAEGGRGPQLRAGTEAALGDWLLLLHADSQLPGGWDRIIAAFVQDPANKEKAAYFRFALDDDAAPARRLERMVDWRCRTFALPYGDQALLIARSFLDSLGGVPPLPLMEDVALVRRIGKSRLVTLDAPLTTSAAKFQRDGYLWRSTKNLFCLFLYFVGVPPRSIRKLYS